MKFSTGVAIVVVQGALCWGSRVGADELENMAPPQMPSVRALDSAASISDYPIAEKPDRVSFVAEKNNRGTTTDIPVKVVTKLCGDADGCSIRIGMHNWDDTGRVASREFIFFYNQRNHTWRASLGDTAGTDSDNITQHINNSWACYFTDGSYKNWADQGDGQAGFGLLSWNQYNADCFLTIID